MTFGERLRNHRLNKGWTQEQVGEALGGRTKNNISQYERGLREPDQKTLHKLAHLFGTTLDELLGYDQNHAMRTGPSLKESDALLIHLPVHSGNTLSTRTHSPKYRPVPAALLDAADYIYYIAPDDALRGNRILAGDLLLIRLGGRPADNEPALLLIDGTAAVRIVQASGDSWVLLSSDVHYPPIAAPDARIEYIGRIVRVEFELE